MSDWSSLIGKVRTALGRGEALAAVPAPPVIAEPVVRLVHSDIGLAELFATSAKAAKFLVEMATAENVAGKVGEFLRTHQCQRVGLPVSPLLERLNLQRDLAAAGFDARRWDELTLDQAYELDCGITDVYAAVAETGSLVIRPTAEHGRALSLVPPIHIAIIEPKNFVPDLVDLFELLGKEGVFPNVTLITGPSKTADIEGHLVTGVHGPGIVQVFILQ